MRRNYELIWAAVFVLNVAGWSFADAFSWLYVLAVQSPITLTVITLEFRSARYHGIWARRVNPKLDDYLQGEI